MTKENKAYKEGYYLKVTPEIITWFRNVDDKLEVWTPTDEITDEEVEEGILLHIEGGYEYEIFKTQGMTWQEAKKSKLLIYYETGATYNRGYYRLTFDVYKKNCI